jgi:hypothetical protein
MTPERLGQIALTIGMLTYAVIIVRVFLRDYLRLMARFRQEDREEAARALARDAEEPPTLSAGPACPPGVPWPPLRLPPLPKLPGMTTTVVTTTTVRTHRKKAP